jgi:hypothetical protein
VVGGELIAIFPSNGCDVGPERFGDARLPATTFSHTALSPQKGGCQDITGGPTIDSAAS